MTYEKYNAIVYLVTYVADNITCKTTKTNKQTNNQTEEARRVDLRERERDTFSANTGKTDIKDAHSTLHKIRGQKKRIDSDWIFSGGACCYQIQ